MMDKETYLKILGDVLYELAKSFEGCSPIQGLALKPEGYDERKDKRGNGMMEIRMSDLERWRYYR